MRIGLFITFLIGLIRLIRILLRNPRTPLISKVLFGLALAYLVIPFDLIPFTVPVLGLLDDAAIVSILLTIAAFLVPRDVMADSWYVVRKQLPPPE